MVPSAAFAHPHIFIETGLEAIVDAEGRLIQVRVTWTYDEFYSLLVTEDMQLDQDFDGQLTKVEEAQLNGFDMNWDEGYYGDLVGALAGEDLSFSRPHSYTADFAHGKITTTHLRDVEGTPLMVGTELVLSPYDETFYTAYDVTLPVQVTGWQACLVSKIEPDINGQLELLQVQLSELDANSDPEDAGLPNIGAQLATEVRIICAGP